MGNQEFTQQGGLSTRKSSTEDFNPPLPPPTLTTTDTVTIRESCAHVETVINRLYVLRWARWVYLVLCWNFVLLFRVLKCISKKAFEISIIFFVITYYIEIHFLNVFFFLPKTIIFHPAVPFCLNNLWGMCVHSCYRGAGEERCENNSIISIVAISIAAELY